MLGLCVHFPITHSDSEVNERPPLSLLHTHTYTQRQCRVSRPAGPRCQKTSIGLVLELTGAHGRVVLLHLDRFHRVAAGRTGGRGCQRGSKMHALKCPPGDRAGLDQIKVPARFEQGYAAAGLRGRKDLTWFQERLGKDFKDQGMSFLAFIKWVVLVYTLSQE